MKRLIENRIASIAQRDCCSKKELEVKDLLDAVIVPGSSGGGGIVYNGQFLQAAMMHRGWYDDSRLQMPKCVETDSRRAIYLGNFYMCWGHCITDGLKHSWAFLPRYRQRFNFDDRIFVYTTTGPGEKLIENFVSLWEALGVSKSQMCRIVKPTKFASVSFPEESFWLDRESGIRFYSKEYVETINAIRRFYVPVLGQPSRTVYLSRTGWKSSKHDFGEKTLQDTICGAFGAECICPEKLSLGEQIRILANCKNLITTEGSLAHNAVFMQDGAELVILRKADYSNGYQYPINQMRKLRVTWLKAHASTFFEFPDQPWRGPFFLRVTNEVGEYFNISPQWPLREYMHYLWHCIIRKCHHVLSVVKHKIVVPIIRAIFK